MMFVPLLLADLKSLTPTVPITENVIDAFINEQLGQAENGALDHRAYYYPAEVNKNF